MNATKAIVYTVQGCVCLTLLSGLVAARVSPGKSGTASAGDVRAASRACTSIAPLSVDFGEVLVGESAVDTVMISNPGAGTLTVSSIGLSGTNANLFNVDTTPFTIPALESHAVRVTFRPERVGTYTASLDLVCDGQPAGVPLNGRGQTLLVVVTPLNPPVAGDSLAFLATYQPDTYQPDTQEIFYRQTGQTAYQSLALSRTGARITATLPAETMTLRGLEYYFRFTRGSTTLTVPGTNPQNNPIRLRVRVDELTADVDLPALRYRMISIPLQPDEPHPDSVLADDFGAYDTTSWRLFRWNPSQQAYVEPPALADTFAPGTAFWLNVRSSERFDVEAANSVNATQPFRLTLAPGWNQIGSPFAFAVAWAGVSGSDQVEPPVFYDGAEYQYEQVVLLPWQGYFVFNPAPAPVVLSFPPAEASEAAAKRATAALLAERGRFGVQLSATVEGMPWRDTQNFMGVAEGASEGRDRLDVAEAPAIGAHLRVSLLEDGERLAAGFKPAAEEGQQWRAEVALEGVQGLLPQRHRVRLEAVPWGTWPEGYTLSLWDEARGWALEVADGTFTLEVAPGQERHLRVVVGTDAYAAEQGEALWQNYPNPFAEQTRIGYVLSRRRRVVVEVYDVLGRRVRTLVRGEREAGRYEVAWDGRDDAGLPLSSGLYVCRLVADEVRFDRTMILIR